MTGAFCTVLVTSADCPRSSRGLQGRAPAFKDFALRWRHIELSTTQQRQGRNSSEPFGLLVRMCRVQPPGVRHAVPEFLRCRECVCHHLYRHSHAQCPRDGCRSWPVVGTTANTGACIIQLNGGRRRLRRSRAGHQAPFRLGGAGVNRQTLAVRAMRQDNKGRTLRVICRASPVDTGGRRLPETWRR
jgi:hypothetical protein